MNKNLKLFITAHNQTSGAFNGLQRDLAQTQSLFAQFGRGGIFNALTAGMGDVFRMLGTFPAALAPALGAFSGLAGAALGALGQIAGGALKLAQDIGSVLVDAIGKAALAGAGLAAAFVGFGIGAAKAAGEDAAAFERAAATFRSYGNAFPRAELEAFSGQMSRLTGVADDQIGAILGLLGSFNLTAQQARQFTLPILDASEALKAAGVSATSLSMQVGKALQTGEVSALRRAGIIIDELRAKTDLYGAVLEGVARQGAGAALVFRSTLPGAFMALGNAFGDFVETLGQPVVEPLNRLTNGLVSLAQNDRIIAGLSAPFRLLGQGIDWAASRLPGLVSQVEKFLGSESWQNFQKGAVALLQKLFTFAVAGLSYVAANWSAIWSVVQNVTVTAFKAIGGTIAGFLNVFAELATLQRNGQTGFLNLAVSTQKFVGESLRLFARLVQGVGFLAASYGLLTAAIGAAARNWPMFAQGLGLFALGSAGARFLSDQIRGIGAAVDALDLSKIGDQFKALEGQQGLLGAFARGFLGFGRAVDSFIAGIPQVVLPELPGTDPTGGAAPGGKPLGADPKLLGDQVKLLEGQVGLWQAIAGAAKAFGSTLKDQGQALRLNLVGLGGWLTSLNALKSGQMALLGVQKAWSEEWLKTLTSVNATAKAVSEVRGEIRGLLFDNSLLTGQADLAGSLFDIGKDIGLDPQQLGQFANQRQNFLLQLAQLESARLSTIERGTGEYVRQQGAVAKLIGDMLRLKKETDTLSGLTPMRFGLPRAPFGLKGPGPERGWLPTGEPSDLGRLFGSLMGLLNPAPRSLDNEFLGAFGRPGTLGQLPPGATAPPGVPPAGVPAGTGAAANPAIGPSPIYIAPVFNQHIGTVNSLEDIERIATDVSIRLVKTGMQSLYNLMRGNQGQ